MMDVFQIFLFNPKQYFLIRAPFKPAVRNTENMMLVNDPSKMFWEILNKVGIHYCPSILREIY